jgi:ABC-type Fe3+-hydroxamate transport system substrate-binding protein
MMEEHKIENLHVKFAKLNIQTLFVSAQSSKDVLDSIRKIGRMCGASDRGEKIADDLERALNKIRNSIKEPKPSILITVGKNMGSGGLDSVFAAGKGTYYNDLLTAAGARNACPESPQQYVNISGEGILRSNPDIIIDIVPDADNEQVERVKGTWKNIPGLKARVAVLTGEYTALPGPSFVRVVKDIRKEIETWQRSFQ